MPAPRPATLLGRLAGPLLGLLRGPVTGSGLGPLGVSGALLATALVAPVRPVRADVLVPRGDAVVLRQQAGEILLQPRVVVAARPETQGAQNAAGAPAGPGAPPAMEVPQPAALRLSPFAVEGDGLEASGSEGPVEVRLRLGWEAGAGFILKLHAGVTAPTWLRQLSIELELDADGVTVLGRDLRPVTLPDGAQASLGRQDPKWITLRRRGAPLLSIVGSDELDGVQVRRLGNRVRLRVDLLSIEARPFFHFAACTGYWKDPNQRLTLPARLVLPGEPFGGPLLLYPGTAVPLVKARYPDGRRAALCITDHADQTAAPTLRAIAGGTSDASDPRWGQGGLLGYGLPITKALWLRSGERDPGSRGDANGGPQKNGQKGQKGKPGGKGEPRGPGIGEASAADPTPVDPDTELLDELGRGSADESGGGRPQLDDPQVVQLADRLHAAGWEIIPHSATPLRDGRELTDRALRYFRRYGARSWIDHQPYTNCEAIINQGYRPGRYGVTDLLKQYGYRYAWSGLDQAPGDLNLLLPRRLEHYVPVVWPVGRLAPGTPDDLWLFRSMLSFIETPRFFEVYTPEALDRLERERGLHIAHTYLENIHPPGSWFGKRNLLVPGARPREVVLDPRLDSLFSGMAARVARGSLWVPTVSRLGDHLDAMGRVSVVIDTDGSAILRSPVPVAGATFLVPLPDAKVLVDGRPAPGLSRAEGETSFWLNLPAGRPVRVHLRDGAGQPLSFLGTAPQRMGRAVLGSKK